MKYFKWSLAAAIAVAIALPGPINTAQAAESAIIDYDRGNYLLSDGTVWIQEVDSEGYQQKNYNIAELQGGYGLTKDGKLMLLWGSDAPKLLPDQSGIIQINGNYALKADGTVWTLDGEHLTDYSDIVMISTRDGGLVTLSRSGELKASNMFGKKVDQFNSASEVSSIAAGLVDKVAVVLKTGKVVLYSRYLFDKDDLTKYIPTTVTDNAADAMFDGNGKLVVLLKDGTVSTTSSSSSDAYKLIKTYSKLSGVTGLVANSGDSIIIRQQDGSLAAYDTETDELEKLVLPGITDLTFQMDATDLTIGDKVPVQIYEKWSNGTSKRIPLAEADLVIEKPYLLQKQADGTLKATGVGETKVTVRAGSASKTINVSISAEYTIDHGAFIKGTMYLPVQAVFQKMGATVQANAATKIFSIKLGALPIQLQLGSDVAIVNGTKVKMTGKVQTVDGTAVFPASLLKTALGAQLNWDGTYQTMVVNFGKAELSVQTKQTDQIVKKKAQGNLVKLIGKTYWINNFDSNYRFQKVTIVDVLPDYKGQYAIALKFPSGKILNSYEMSGDELLQTLGNKQYFFTVDPYKTYKYSAAIWAKIKAGKISTGMTKQQVELSWGTPVNKSAMQGSGIQVETWQYAYYNYVTFTNGVVSMIYTS